MPIEITMPRLSDTMEAGTILKWNVSEGDTVSSGEAVADIETDKATMEMQVFDDGTLAKILIQEGQSVPVGTVIAILAEEGEDPQEAVAAVSTDGAKKAPAAKEDTAEKQAPRAEKEVAEGGGKIDAAQQEAAQRIDTERRAQPADVPSDSPRMRISPVAQRLADDHNIDLHSIQGTGPSGRIIKRDVLQAIQAARETAAAIPPAAQPQQPAAAAPSTPVAPVPVTEQPAQPLESRMIQLSSMRQTIARRLVQSKTTIPHYQVTVTFNMDPLLELRETLNKQLESQGVKLSVNDFIVRACALAMHQHHEFNASWTDEGIQIHGDVNIGIAIAVPPERGGGLVVATIRNADQKGLRTISAESKHFAHKARTRGLSIEDMSDSTFTLSNLGMFGVNDFTAIINPPNSAILAIGAAIEKPVVRDHQLAVGHEMAATLSCDHRIIDGAMAAQYMQTLKQFMENPGTLLV